MREILFRGKRKDNGEWVKGDLRQDKDLGESYISGWNYYTDCAGAEREPFEHEVIPETVGQYTGVIDMFDEKVFEGDYIYCDADEEAGIIKFDDGEFVAIFGNVIDSNQFADIMGCSRVFGNIHDNPKLLGFTEEK